PEMYVPSTDNFVQMQPNSIIRVYHSVSLLLPDGRVFNAGGGLCGDFCNVNHFDGQIFTPQNLLTSSGALATRPVINSVNVSGRRISITTNSAVSSASLIRYGTATHTVNTDQRRIPLTLANAGTNQYTADAPSDSGILLPGYYMLFVLNSNGVPSVSKTVKFLV
ncbi:MAG: galactose oxidase early set domain-containing protein, partial [Candidatus Binatia bacterium]